MEYFPRISEAVARESNEMTDPVTEARARASDQNLNT